MTRRTRSHVLEDLSLTVLRATLPSHWVVHDFRRDYGIDVQVEVFDEDGVATGLKFHGQLKATDAKPDSDVLSLDRQHFDYWASHSDPVLLFRYFSQINAFRWCWMHEVAWRIRKSAKTLDVGSYLHRYDAVRTPMEIREFLQLRRDALFTRIMPPYSIGVTRSDDNYMEAHALAGQIRDALSRTAFQVTRGDQTPTHFGVLYDGDRLVISHLGLAGFVADLNALPKAVSVAEFAVLLLLLTACRYQKAHVARPIAVNSCEVLKRAAADNHALLIDALFFSVGVETAVELLGASEGREISPELWASLCTAGMIASKRYGESEQWLSRLRKWESDPPSPENAGATSYNLGNACLQLGRWEDAIDAFSRAVERDPDYQERDYYWAELGAALFETNRYGEALDCYERAAALGAYEDIDYKLADVLFNLGRYREARELLLKHEGEETTSHWMLLLTLCGELVDDWGIEAQSLREISDSEHDAIQALAPCPELDQCRAVLRPFIQANAIDPYVAFNAGHYARKSGHYEMSAYRYLTCALRERGDAEAWAQAIGSAWQAGNEALMVLLLDSGQFFVKDRLLEALHAHIGSSDPDPEVQAEFRRLLQDMVKAVPQTQESPVFVRINGSEPLRIDTK